jgi:hypothetical protein
MRRAKTGKQIRGSAESLSNKPLTKRQKAPLEAVTERQNLADTSKIDFSDIPAHR